jgi:hypothetical protein
MTFSLKKHTENGIISIAIALPNLAITLTAVTVLAVAFHWSGFYATLAYLVGQFFSVNYSAFFGSYVDMTITFPKWLGGRTYRYSHKK